MYDRQYLLSLFSHCFSHFQENEDCCHVLTVTSAHWAGVLKEAHNSGLLVTEWAIVFS